MKQGLSLRTSQHLALTPQLQQSIRLLHLSALELNQEIQVQLEQNPFLEADDSALIDEPANGVSEGPVPDLAQVDVETTGFDETEPSVATDWQQLDELPHFDSSTPWEDAEAPRGESNALSADAFEESIPVFGTVDLAQTGRHREQDDDDGLASFSAETTLVCHLEEQALGLRLAPPEHSALFYLMGNLNEDGYLEVSWDDLVEDYANHAEFIRSTPAVGSLEQRLQGAARCLEQGLDYLQDMDPPGVGARSLQECLRIQLLGLLSAPIPPDESAATEKVLCISLALKVVEQPLALLAKRDYRQLAKQCGHPEKVVRLACDLIRRLEPKPGRVFGDTRASTLTPEVLVKRNGSIFEAVLNHSVRPHLSVNARMAQTVGSDKEQSGGPMQKALTEARWFVRSVEQRFQTILRVSQCIVLHQQAFFAHGPLQLKPLVLREVADALGLHESTVSRVTTAKYMATPQGTFELKYFFTSGLSTDNGANTSSTAVRTMIGQWVAAENPKKPLSDQKLSEMLADKGIDCARRTVAKYRESLKIAPTSLRRTV